MNNLLQKYSGCAKLSNMISKSPQSQILKKLKNFLPKDHFVRGVTILAGGTTLAQVLPLVLAPILTRLYSPNDFGVLAVYVSLLTMSSNFASFRYEFAIPIAKDNKTVISLVALCLVLVSIMGALSAIGFFFFYDELGRIERLQTLEQYIILLPVGFLTTGLYNVFNYWAVRERMYSIIARTKITQGVSGVLTQLGLGFLKIGPSGLLFGHIIGQSAGFWTLTKQFWTKNKNSLHFVSVSNLIVTARRYKDFPLYQSSGKLLNSAGLQIPTLLFAMYYGIEFAGWFYLTQKVLAAPITLISTSVSKVFWGEAARLSSKPVELQKLFRKITIGLFKIGLLPSIVFAIGGQWVFELAFGTEWIQSGIFVQIMSISFLLKFTTDSSINFAIIEKHKLTVLWALIRLSLVILGIMSAVWFKLPGIWAVVFFATAMVISYVIRYIMWQYAIKKIILISTKFNPSVE